MYHLFKVVIETGAFNSNCREFYDINYLYQLRAITYKLHRLSMRYLSDFNIDVCFSVRWSQPTRTQFFSSNKCFQSREACDIILSHIAALV